MRHAANYVFSVGSFLICVGIVAPSVNSASDAKPVDSETEQISSYKSWAKVNPKPLKLPAPLNVLCAAPDAVPKDGVDSSSNPHRQKFFTVYVNEIGQRAMLKELKPGFPAGSVVVKEKLSAQSSEPELLTAMIKREKGFNPESGDWEFLVLDGSGKKIEARGKLETCQSCHATKKNSDFVFRSYLPEETRRGLR